MQKSERESQNKGNAGFFPFLFFILHSDFCILFLAGQQIEVVQGAKGFSKPATQP
jgi:hypothetical protein